jgi:hypothetical protein
MVVTEPFFTNLIHVRRPFVQNSHIRIYDSSKNVFVALKRSKTERHRLHLRRIFFYVLKKAKICYGANLDSNGPCFFQIRGLTRMQQRFNNEWYWIGPLLIVSGIPLLSAKNIIRLRSVSGIYVFFINKADLLVLGLIWGGVEVICVLLYVNYPEKNR